MRADCGVGTPDSFTCGKTVELVGIPVRITSEFVQLSDLSNVSVCL